MAWSLEDGMLHAWMTALTLSASAAPTGGPASPTALDRHQPRVGPHVELWTSGDEVYRRGDRVRVYFRASDDSYITVFRIDTDGRVRVLFPADPWEDNFARREQRYEVRSSGDRQAFVVDDYPGQGYVFAVASVDPFGYRDLVRGDHWDYRAIANSGRVTGDPYIALTDLVDRIIPPNYAEYSYDILPYYVEQKYDYPRFLCYDCHAYASYPYWNPYQSSCFKFRIVVYDDPYYYPVRYLGRARVVTRTTVIAPRYVFKDRPSAATPYVTRVRQTPVDQTGRRLLIDPGVSGRSVTGVGRVPAPIPSDPRATPERRGVSTPVTGDVRRAGEAPSRTLERPAPQPEPAFRPEVRRPDAEAPQARPDPPAETPTRPRPQLERREPERPVVERPAVTRPQPERPQAEPQREPETQPRAEPRREPQRSQPRAEPQRSQPRAEPRREPERRPAPRAAPPPPKQPERSDGDPRRPN